MLLQTNSYHVPKEKRAEHARLLARFRLTLARLGCDHFEVYEQVGSNWSGGESTGRFVQLMRFRDRKHQQQVQESERSDPQAQTLIKEFCDLIEFPNQQQEGQFAVGFYSSVLAVSPTRLPSDPNQVPSETNRSSEPPIPPAVSAAAENGQDDEFKPEDILPPSQSPSPDPSIHHS